MLRALSDILSNSSMQQTPLSLSTRAPLSSTISRVSASCINRRKWNPGPSKARPTGLLCPQNLPSLHGYRKEALQSLLCQQYASMGLGPCKGIHQVGVSRDGGVRPDLGDVGCEAHGAAAAAAGVQAARRDLVDVGQQLRLADAWVAHEEHVELPTDLASSEILQQASALHHTTLWSANNNCVLLPCLMLLTNLEARALCAVCWSVTSDWTCCVAFRAL